MNIYEPRWDAAIGEPGSVLRAVRLGQHAGSRRLAANLYELETGAAVSPLHFHHSNEELLIVISGTPTLRRGSGDGTILKAGDVVAFRTGRDGTHQILNRSPDPSRVLVCATTDIPEVAEQVENGVVAVITSDGLRLLCDAPAVAAP